MRPTATDVRLAAEALKGTVLHTPLLESTAIGVALKCELLQHTHSFKVRGASIALSAIAVADRARGVVASSAGNHGLGLAWAAGATATPVTVFVPRNASRVKVAGMRAMGAHVVERGDGYDAAHAHAVQYAREHSLPFIDPCSGVPLLAGQGTVAVEVLRDLPGLTTIVIPVGGGGLLTGIGAYLREVAPGVRIVGVQSAHTNAMHAAFAANGPVAVPTPVTLADGLMGQIDAVAYENARFALDELLLVDESSIARAMRWLWETHALRSEGSGAVGLAAVLDGAITTDARTVVVLSGGNVDDERWRAALASGDLP